MARGGRRANQTGRPKNAVPTKLARLPVDIDKDALLSLRDDLSTLVQAWQAECKEHCSSPRYDKAKMLLAELERLLSGLRKESQSSPQYD